MSTSQRRRSLPRRPLFIGMMAALSGAGLLSSPAWGAEEGAKAASPTMVPMDEIAVPIIDGAHMEGILRFTLVLHAQDSAAAVRITASLAKLRSVAMIAGIDFARLRASPFSAVDVRSLHILLDKALKSADPGISQALIVRVGATAQ